ncbi:hypothetical protein B0H13DRAFT_1862887 [Mycena leptocephala]|nr:hypothetical protein B0H13DRAFT_1862887 [Mycena leptocephala]
MDLDSQKAFVARANVLMAESTLVDTWFKKRSAIYVNCQKYRGSLQLGPCDPVISLVSCVPCRTRKIACDYRDSYLSAHIKDELSWDDSSFQEGLKLLKTVKNNLVRNLFRRSSLIGPEPVHHVDPTGTSSSSLNEGDPSGSEFRHGIIWIVNNCPFRAHLFLVAQGSLPFHGYHFSVEGRCIEHYVPSEYSDLQAEVADAVIVLEQTLSIMVDELDAWSRIPVVP